LGAIQGDGKTLTLAGGEVVTTGWHLDRGLEWLPLGAGPQESLRNVLLLTAGFLVLSLWLLRRREFPE
jgi:hypothetical protein